MELTHVLSVAELVLPPTGAAGQAILAFEEVLHLCDVVGDAAEGWKGFRLF